MGVLLKGIAILGIFTSLITPFTLIVGIVNAIKADKNESGKYMAMAVISAYLIIIPLIVVSINILGL